MISTQVKSVERLQKLEKSLFARVLRESPLGQYYTASLASVHALRSVKLILSKPEYQNTIRSVSIQGVQPIYGSAVAARLQDNILRSLMAIVERRVKADVATHNAGVSFTALWQGDNQQTDAAIETMQAETMNLQAALCQGARM